MNETLLTLKENEKELKELFKKYDLKVKYINNKKQYNIVGNCNFEYYEANALYRIHYVEVYNIKTGKFETLTQLVKQNNK